MGSSMTPIWPDASPYVVCACMRLYRCSLLSQLTRATFGDHAYQVGGVL